MDLHVDIKHNYIYIPLKNNDDIVGYKMITKDGEENTFPPNSACGIVTTKRSSKAAVIVHNIKDFLTLLLYNLSENIVCLPHGKPILILSRTIKNYFIFNFLKKQMFSYSSAQN